MIKTIILILIAYNICMKIRKGVNVPHQYWKEHSSVYWHSWYFVDVVGGTLWTKPIKTSIFSL